MAISTVLTSLISCWFTGSAETRVKVYTWCYVVGAVHCLTHLTYVAGGLGCSSPWLPFDIYMEAAMEGRRLTSVSNAEILAGTTFSYLEE